MTTEQIEFVLENYLFEMLVGLFGLIVVLFIVIVVQGIMLSSMKAFYGKIYKKKPVTNKESADVNEIVVNNKLDLDLVKAKTDLLASEVERVDVALRSRFSKTATHKYDAFDTVAGQMSFVYVLLNDFNDGIILNGIHSNEGHYIYMKEVEKGKPTSLVSKEEKETLIRAIDRSK